MTNAFTLNVDQEGIGTLTFDLPGESVNKITPQVMEEFSRVIDDLSKKSNLKALVIKSGKPDMFIAGADINALKNIASREDALEKTRRGTEVLDRLQALPFPTIALIDGVCLGGGLELALACQYRVVTDNPKTRLGLPEVTLGIIPGWGGTQRLPRLVGLKESLPMILAGKTVPGQKAWKIHLADALVSQTFSDEQMKSFIRTAIDPKGSAELKKRQSKKGFLSCAMECNPLGRKFLFSMARRDVIKKTKGHYPAPLTALDVVEKTQNLPAEERYAKERWAFADLAVTPTAKNLLNLFFVNEALKKDLTRRTESTTMKSIKQVGVLGGGIMGGGIAWLFSNADIPVRVKDVNLDAVAKGFEQAAKVYKKLKEIKKLRANEVNVKMHHITGTTNYTGFMKLDMVVEAISENFDLKKRVFSELEEHIRPDTIVCTNTSTFSVNDLASAFKHPERFLGMHFFNPVNRMPLVEIIPGEKTDPAVVASTVEVVKRTGKTAVVVKDCPGFLVNRILFPYLLEALTMLQEGADFEYLDKVMEEFGMPMGPFLLSDEVGLDVCLKGAKSLEAAYSGRMKVGNALVKLQEAELLGKKNGKGFYLHQGKQRKRNLTIDKLFAKETHQPSAQEVRSRLLLPMINEAARCLEEGIVEKPEFLDMAMIMGTGFPPFRGGLLRYADTIGAQALVEQLQSRAKVLGARFEPAEYLLKMKQAGGRFYS